MIFTKQKDFLEPSLLKNKNSAHFLYPIQPLQVSAIDPIEDVYENSMIVDQTKEQNIIQIRQIVDNTVSEHDDKTQKINCFNTFSLLQDEYIISESKYKDKIISIFQNEILQITSNYSIIFILIFLPLQIAFTYGHVYLGILYSIIFLIKTIQVLRYIDFKNLVNLVNKRRQQGIPYRRLINYQKGTIQFFNYQLDVINLRQILQKYLKQMILNNFSTILAFLMMSQEGLSIVQWIAYFYIFMNFMPTFNAVLSQIKRYLICRCPKQQIGSYYFGIAIKVILIIHILNCYLFQSLHLNQVDYSYFDTLTNLTINVIILNNNTQYQYEQVSIALFLSYLFMILIITGSNQQTNQLSKDLQIYFQRNDVPIQIKLKIYDEYINKSFQSTHIHKQLSSELQAQIVYNQRIAFIQENFSSYDEATKFKLTQLCTILYVQSGQFITKLKQKDDNSLYYLIQGKASIQLPKSNKFPFKSKQTFGYISFYTQCLRTATIRCDTDCTIYKLQRQEFLACLTNLDKQIFQLTKDSIEFRKCLPIKCLCCQQSTHVISNCPDVCIVSDYFSHISTNYNNLIQPRMFYQRKQFKSTKSILTLKDQPQLKFKVESQSNYSSSNQLLNKDDISLVKYMNNYYEDSYKLSSEKILSEKCSTIRGQLLSSNGIVSQQDILRAIPQVIQEVSQDSMSIKSQEKQPSQVPMKRSFTKNPTHSDSSLKLSPVFQRESKIFPNYLISNQDNCCNSQVNNPTKTEIVNRSGNSSFQTQGENENSMCNVKDDIDRMEIFQLYYPDDNYDKIIQCLIRQI